VSNALVYWRYYRKNTAGDYAGWHSNSQLFGTLGHGDRMWLVTSGKVILHDAEQAGFGVVVCQMVEQGRLF